MRVDWPTLLDDIAYLLGDVDPMNPTARMPCMQKTLAAYLKVARGTLRGWLDGSRPKHDEGERLIEVWCRLNGKARDFTPVNRSSTSAAQMR
jgi:hypothetical protein